MKKAFTLIELLVVIGIIGVLAGILLTSFSGGTEAARAAKCLSNMRNLAQVTISCAAKGNHIFGNHFPLAGSRAVMTPQGEDIVYLEESGWISWLSKNDEYGMRGGAGAGGGDSAANGGGGKSHPKNFVALENASAYSSAGNNEDQVFAIENGAIWPSMNGNRDVYVCPEHALAVQKKGLTANWSYVMNAYFGYDWSKGSKAPVTTGDWGKTMSDVDVRPDKRLLFAELPIYGTGAKFDEGGSANTATYPASGGTECDCVLQYKAYEFQRKWSGTAESIAFNHKSNKKFVAHVVFADGHAEKLQKPRSGGITDEQLTALLCSGKDIGYDGKVYTWVNDTDKTE